MLTSRKQPIGDAEEQQAHALAADLGYHALALDVTGSSLLSFFGAKPFRDFRAKLARPEKDALVLAEMLADTLPNGHEKSIAQTMLSSLSGLGGKGLDFLRLASELAVAPIPASLVATVFEEADKLSHEDAEESVSLAFKQVTSTSLAEVVGEKHDARLVHTLVSRTVRFHEKTSPGRASILRSAAVEALRAEIARAAEDPRLHQQIEFHVAHARQLVLTPNTLKEANLIAWVAEYDAERGAYASARTLRERELEFRRRVQGPEHPETLRSLNGLGNAICDLGDLTTARNLQEETLSIRRQVMGPEHPDTLTSMNNLAITLLNQGDLEGARELHQQELDICRRVLGPSHPDTLISMDTLASTLHAQGDFAGAFTLQMTALAMRLIIFGSDHKYTVTSMSNLALTLQDKGDLKGARELMEKAVEILRRVLGPEHVHTTGAMNNLAQNLRALGELEAARALQEEVLAIQHRTMGRDHPSTLQSMNNLAVILHDQGDSAGAFKLSKEAMELRRRVLGPEHPNTLETMGNLAAVLSLQGDLVEARKLYEETLAISCRVLGPQHPDTTVRAWGLFQTLRRFNKHSEAQAVLTRHLLWLLDRDPAAFGADQGKIREYVAPFVVPVGPRKHLVQHVIHGDKIGRNAPCHCGSGKKYKKCCGG